MTTHEFISNKCYLLLEYFFIQFIDWETIKVEFKCSFVMYSLKIASLLKRENRSVNLAITIFSA